jgi:hypothetical protein
MIGKSINIISIQIESRMFLRSGLLLLSIFNVLFVSAAVPTVANCDPNSVFHIDSLSLTPNGVNSTLKVSYDVPAEITDGVAKYSCTLNGIPVLSESKPLCEDLKCPIAVGHHEDVSDSANPTVTGTLVCTIKWQSPTAESLLCIKLTNVNSECAQ